MNGGYNISNPELKESSRWHIVQNYLTNLESTNITIHGFVVMDTHFHALISYNQNINFCLKDHLYFSEIYLTEISTFINYQYAYKYLYRNPVEACLCQKVEHYPWSSLQILLGKSKSRVNIVDNLGLIQNPFKTLNWLNNMLT